MQTLRTLKNVSGEVSKKRQATTASWMASLGAASKKMGLTPMTKLLEEAANLVKGAKDEKKEPKHLLGKAASVAPSATSHKRTKK